MKTLLVALFISTAALAAPGDVLLTCTNSGISDLQKIVITEGEVDSEIVVTEVASNGLSSSEIKSSKDLIDSRTVELSSLNGYTRTLSQDKFGWSIERRDECTSGYSVISCK